jgi:response regulator NasT
MIEPLRIAIAAVGPERAAGLVRDVTALGHELSVIEPAAAELRRDTLDVILVGRTAGDAHCLSLVTLAAHERRCAAVVVVPTFDESFAEAAAESGAFGYLAQSGQAPLAAALAIAHFRHLDQKRLLEAFARRVVIEQAKGILMTSNGITSERAFALLRRQSQRTNRKVVEIAEAVVNSHTLLLPSESKLAPPRQHDEPAPGGENEVEPPAV